MNKAPPSFTGPVAYLTGEYPRATDTFIQREVSALRDLGLELLTTSVRRTGAAHLVGPEQKAEAAGTFYVLSAARAPLTLLSAHIGALLRNPSRYGRALALAMRTAPPGLKARLYQLFYFAEAVVLAAYLQRRRVRHIHNHIAKASCTVAMLASEVSGIPYSFTLHGPDIFFEPRHWRLDEKIARAAFVACISHFCRAQAMAFSEPTHWDKLHIVHCGIDPGRYENHPAGGGNRLLFIGRLAAVKGLPVLFEALAGLVKDLPKLRLYLIGDGPERAVLEAQVRALGLVDQVNFLGYRNQSEVAKALGESDMLILPSFAEGLPVVLMEAMAAGVPVVTTRIAGVPELVKDGVCGLLVAPGDSVALAEAIRKLAVDPALRQRLGKAGVKAVKAEFVLKDEAAWLAEIIASCHSTGPKPGLRPDRGRG